MDVKDKLIFIILLFLLAGAVILNLPETSTKANLGPGSMDLEFGPDDGTYMTYDAVSSADTIGIETPYQIELVQVGDGRYELRFSEAGTTNGPATDDGADRHE